MKTHKYITPHTHTSCPALDCMAPDSGFGFRFNAVGEERKKENETYLTLFSGVSLRFLPRFLG